MPVGAGPVAGNSWRSADRQQETAPWFGEMLQGDDQSVERNEQECTRSRSTRTAASLGY
jgi:hypothetical protein